MRIASTMGGFISARMREVRCKSFGRLLLLGMLLVVGCGGPPEERLYPVKGTITLDGQPLTRGDIWFVPDEAKGTKHTEYSLSKINPDGTYELQTFQKPGAKAGWYKVAVFATKNEPPSNTSGWVPDWIADEKYSSHMKSGLEVEVVAEPQPGRYDFQVTAPISTN